MTEFFSFQNSPKNLDPSYKMDLDYLHSLRIIAKLHRTDVVICSHSREEKTVSYSRITFLYCLRLKNELSLLERQIGRGDRDKLGIIFLIFT